VNKVKIANSFLLLSHIFCVVTSALLWKSGKLLSVSQSSESSATQPFAQQNSSQFSELLEKINLLSMAQQNSSQFSELLEKINLLSMAQQNSSQFSELLKKIDLLSAENAILKAQMKESYSNQTRLIQSLYDSNLVQDSKIQNIANDLNFLTLGNHETTIGNVSIGLSLQGYVVRTGDNSNQLVSRSGVVSLSNPGNGWVAKAASANSFRGYSLYMRQRSTSNYEKWNLNANCSFLNSETVSFGNVLVLENAFNFDWDEDGFIGPQIIQPLALTNQFLFGKTITPGYFAL
jgi:hypothetical protein